MAACIQNDKFLEITETASKTISSIDGTFQAALNNHNALLSMLDGVISGKTGFTAKAGYCYVGAYLKMTVLTPLLCWHVGGQITRITNGKIRKH